MKRPTHQNVAPIARAFQLLGLLGLTMMACILAGTWAGIKLDAWLGTRGIATVLGIVAGVFAGLVATGLLLYRSISWKP